MFRCMFRWFNGTDNGMRYTAQFVARHLRNRSAEDYFNQPQFREVMELAATKSTLRVARAYGKVSDDELPLRMAAAVGAAPSTRSRTGNKWDTHHRWSISGASVGHADTRR